MWGLCEVEDVHDMMVLEDADGTRAGTDGLIHELAGELTFGAGFEQIGVALLLGSLIDSLDGSRCHHGQ